MIDWAVVLLVLAVIAAVIGFRFLVVIAKVLFVLFLIGFIVLLLLGSAVC